MMPVSWTSVMTWLAAGVPVTVARLAAVTGWVCISNSWILKNRCIFVRSMTKPDARVLEGCMLLPICCLPDVGAKGLWKYMSFVSVKGLVFLQAVLWYLSWRPPRCRGDWNFYVEFIFIYFIVCYIYIAVIVLATFVGNKLLHRGRPDVETDRLLTNTII